MWSRQFSNFIFYVLKLGPKCTHKPVYDISYYAGWYLQKYYPTKMSRKKTKTKAKKSHFLPRNFIQP